MKHKVYAVVNEPFKGKWKKPQDEKSLLKRKTKNGLKPCRIWKGVLLKDEDNLPCKAYGYGI